MQARGVGSDPDGVAATDRRPSAHSRHETPLTASQPRPAVDVGVGTELLDEVDGDFEAVLGPGAQILGPDADSPSCRSAARAGIR